jgi:hypothetical protein
MPYFCYKDFRYKCELYIVSLRWEEDIPRAGEELPCVCLPAIFMVATGDVILYRKRTDGENIQFPFSSVHFSFS